MDFGFPAAVDNGQLDPSTQAILANLSAPQPSQPAQDAAPPQAQPAPQGQSDNWNPNPLLAALRWLSTGGPPQDAMQAERLHHYQAQYQAQAMSQLPQLMSTLPPQARAAIAMGGPGVWNELSKNMAPQTRSAGQTTDYWGGAGTPGGRTAGTDTYGTDDKSGLPTQYGPGIGGYRVLGPSLGGDYTAANGVISSGRTGQVANTYSTPQQLPPGTTPGAFTPTVGGAPLTSGPQGSPPAMPPGPAASALPSAGQPPPQNQPRGIRNLNFGNVKAPAQGAFPGQTGVDDQGYAVFGDPVAGVNAARQVLQGYAKKGVNTVGGVVSTWAPQAGGNNTASYAQYVSQQLGVRPDQPLNMADPRVQQSVLGAMFNFENGPAAMSAWRHNGSAGGGGAASGAPANVAAANAQGGWSLGSPVGQPRPMTADERQKWGISPEDKTPYAMGADGLPKTVGNDVFDPKAQVAYTAQVTGMEPYKNYTLSRGFLGTMQTLMKQPGGFADLGLIENAGKTINPTVAIRPNMIDQYAKEVGWPDWLVGEVSSVVNHGGKLTQQGRNALMNIAQANVQSHWDQMQPILKKVDYDAKRLGTTREALIPDLVQMPDQPSAPYPGASIPNSPQGGSSGGQGGGGTQAQAVTAARAAIAKGADPAAVRARLQAHGFSASGL